MIVRQPIRWLWFIPTYMRARIQALLLYKVTYIYIRAHDLSHMWRICHWLHGVCSIQMDPQTHFVCSKQCYKEQKLNGLISMVWNSYILIGFIIPRLGSESQTLFFLRCACVILEHKRYDFILHHKNQMSSSSPVPKLFQERICSC